jgi:hypothetical protein
VGAAVVAEGFAAGDAGGGAVGERRSASLAQRHQLPRRPRTLDFCANPGKLSAPPQQPDNTGEGLRRLAVHHHPSHVPNVSALMRPDGARIRRDSGNLWITLDPAWALLPSCVLKDVGCCLAVSWLDTI